MSAVGAPPDRNLTMTERRTVPPHEDPVCGMAVAPDNAREQGLASTFEGTEHVFCGHRCLLEFRDDPEPFLDPAYVLIM